MGYHETLTGNTKSD